MTKSIKQGAAELPDTTNNTSPTASTTQTFSSTVLTDNAGYTGDLQTFTNEFPEAPTHAPTNRMPPSLPEKVAMRMDISDNEFIRDRKQHLEQPVHTTLNEVTHEHKPKKQLPAWVRCVNVALTQILISWDASAWMVIAPHLAKKGREIEVIMLLAPVYYVPSLVFSPLYLNLTSRVRVGPARNKNIQDSGWGSSIVREVASFGSHTQILCVALLYIIGSFVPAVDGHWAFVIIGRFLAGCGLAAWESQQPPRQWVLSAPWGSGRRTGSEDGERGLLESIALAENRPLRISPLLDDFGWMQGTFMVLGCLATGAVIEHTTWHYCLCPIAVFAALIALFNAAVVAPSVVLWLRNILGPANCMAQSNCTQRNNRDRRLWTFGLREVDWIGFAILSASVALLWVGVYQGAGMKGAWSSPPILVPLVLSAALMIAFVFVEARVALRPIINFRWLHIRNVAIGFVCMVLLGVTHSVHMFYLPLYFVYVKGDRGIHLAVRIFAYMLGWIPGSLLVEWVNSRHDSYRPFLWGACAMLCVGSGLLTLLTGMSPVGAQIGYLILNGIGICVGVRGVLCVVHSAAYSHDKVPAAMHLFRFLSRMGHLIGMAIINGVVITRGHYLWNKYISVEDGWDDSDITLMTLIRKLDIVAHIPFKNISDASALYFFDEVFCEAFSIAFYILIPVTGLAFVLSLFTKHVSQADRSNF